MVPAAPRARSVLALTLVALVWGTNFTLMKDAMEAFAPSGLTALRFLVASVAFALVLWRTEGFGRPTRGQWIRLVGLGLLGNTVYQLAYTQGLSRTTPANASLLVTVTPALVALLSWYRGREPLPLAKLVGLALAIGGVVFVVSARGPDLGDASRLGSLLLVVAAIGWALYTVGVRELGPGLSPLQITGLTLFTGTPGLLVAGAPALLRQDWGAVRTTAWVELVFSALVAVVFAYVVWNRSVQGLGASRTAVFNCLVPVFATLVAWAARGERPTWVQLVGAGAIVGGILLAQRGGASTSPPSSARPERRAAVPPALRAGMSPAAR